MSESKIIFQRFELLVWFEKTCQAFFINRETIQQLLKPVMEIMAMKEQAIQRLVKKNYLVV